MRITFLGTSHGDPTYCRYNSAILLETGGKMYLFDAGEPVTSTLIRTGREPTGLKAVFITHMHGDHAGGLPILLKFLIKYHRKRPDPDRITHIHLPDPASTEGLIAWMKAMYVPWPCPAVEIHDFRPESHYADETVRVTAEKTQHLEYSQAYIIEAEGKRVVITGDLRGDFSDFPKAALNTPCDLCICETTHYDYEKNALPILKKAPIRRMIHTHVADKWHGDGEGRVRELLNRLPYPAHLAFDGDSFDL